MASTIELTRPRPDEAQKAKLVCKAAAIAAATLEPAERGLAERIVAQFCEHVPPADVAARSPRDLCGAALSLWRFAARRRPGHAKIRVFNPEAATDGWSSPGSPRIRQCSPARSCSARPPSWRLWCPPR